MYICQHRERLRRLGFKRHRHFHKEVQQGIMHGSVLRLIRNDHVTMTPAFDAVDLSLSSTYPAAHIETLCDGEHTPSKAGGSHCHANM